MNLENFLGYVVKQIDEYGWVSASTARNQCIMSTAALTIKYMNGSEWQAPTDDQYNRAMDALEWASVLGHDPNNEYFTKLGNLARQTEITEREAGMAASIIPAYMRVVEQNAPDASEYVGVIGERMTTSFTVSRIVNVANAWGSSWLHVGKNAQGNILVFSLSNHRLTEGMTYRIVGTVKKHDTYQGKKQTSLNRVRVNN